ncbi:unnamed protein product, partial [Chrysoparadoxa australica]
MHKAAMLPVAGLVRACLVRQALGFGVGLVQSPTHSIPDGMGWRVWGRFGRKVTMPSRQARVIGTASLANGGEGEQSKSQLDDVKKDMLKVQSKVVGVEAKISKVKAALTPGGDPYLGLTGEHGHDRDWLLTIWHRLQQEKSYLRRNKSYLWHKQFNLRQKEVAMLQASSVAPAATIPQGAPPVTLDITTWLKKRGWRREKRPEYSTVFCPHPPRPERSPDDRVGRDEAIKALWDEAYYQTKDGMRYANRTPLIYTQGSPGVGKTFILQELWRRDEKDMNRLSEPVRSWAQDATVYGIQFNGKTPLLTSERKVAVAAAMGDDLDMVHISLRMIYSEFVLGGDEIEWEDFLEAVLGDLGSGVLSRDWLDVFTAWDLLAARKASAQSGTVLLVDELGKLCEDPWSKTSDMARSARSRLCRLLDDRDGPDALIFTTLSSTFIAKERTGSRRGRCSVPLGLLSNPELQALLERTIPDTLQRLREQLASALALFSGGHARTAVMLAELLDGLNPGDALALREVVQKVVAQWVLKFALVLDHGYYLAVARAAVLGHYVKLDQQVGSISGSAPNLTWEDALASGHIVGSEGKWHVAIPVVPGVNLAAFKMRPDDASDMAGHNIASGIEELMKTIYGFSNDGKGLEQFHAAWECLIRLCRFERHKKMSLAKLYVDGEPDLCSSHAPLLKERMVDGTAPVTQKVFSSLEELRLPSDNTDNSSSKHSLTGLTQHVWVPTDLQQQGFDLVLVFETDEGPMIVPIELKWSQEAAGTTLYTSDFKTKHRDAIQLLSSVGWEPEHIAFVLIADRPVSEGVREDLASDAQLSNMM